MLFHSVFQKKNILLFPKFFLHSLPQNDNPRPTGSSPEDMKELIFICVAVVGCIAVVVALGIKYGLRPESTGAKVGLGVTFAVGGICALVGLAALAGSSNGGGGTTFVPIFT